MTFLPVVERELRVAARHRQTYWTRFSAALVALAVSTWIWGWLTQSQPAHERGQIVFRVISGLSLIYTLVAGIGITSDTLSAEKREGTLGLLFLTALHGYDVILGKLTATSLHAFYRLLAVVPILAVPLLLGALTLAELWRMVLVLTNTLFFSLAAGMVVSAVSRHERRAAAGTCLLILAVTAGPALVGLLVFLTDRTVPYNPAWLLSSSVFTAVLAMDTAYKAQPFHYWSGVAILHLLAWGFLALASTIVRRNWQDRPASGPAAEWQVRSREWRFGKGERRSVFRRRLLSENPLLWRALRDRLRPAYLLAVLSGGGALWLWLYWKFPQEMLDPSVYVLTSYSAHILLKLWLASEACRPLAEDRQCGALELLLSTPLSVPEILLGYILALQRQFFWPVVLVLAADATMLVAASSELGISMSNWLLFGFGRIILLIADLNTIIWVGLWLSLSLRNANRAVVGTIARVLVLPWAGFVLGLSLMAVVELRTFEASEFGLMSTAFAIALLNNALFFAWAKTNLEERFRLVATQRFGTGLSEHPAGGRTATPDLVPEMSAKG